MQVTDEMVEAGCQGRTAAVNLKPGTSFKWPDDFGEPYLQEVRASTRAALEAALPLIRGAVAEEQRKHFTDPHAADWYWRDMDPDDSGDSISEAIHMMGEGVVCHVRSSFTGPDFFAAIVPVLDAESDDTEELIADTEEECVRLVKERYAAIRALSPREAGE